MITEQELLDSVILLVDDDNDLRETYADLLKFEGFDNVYQAEDGLTAVEFVKGTSIDLVISDLKMPGMDGMETIAKIREYHPDITAMILTGYGTMDIAIKAFSDNTIDDFLQKPVENDDLIAKIKKHLQTRSAAKNIGGNDMVKKDFGAQKTFFGQFLVDNNYINEEQLIDALETHRKEKKMIGIALVDIGAITEDNLVNALADFKGYEVATDKDFNQISEKMLALISEKFAKEHVLLPLYENAIGLKVVMMNPDDLFVTDTLKMMTQKKIIPILSTRKKIFKNIEEQYSKLASAQRASLALNEIYGDEDINVQDVETQKDSDDEVNSAPIIKLVNGILQKAVFDDGTSDIHIEPEEKYLRIRFRKDGDLYIPSGYEHLPKHLHSSIVARIKILTNTMKIDIKQIPQDGKIRKIIGNREIDFRVGSLPTINGEKIVLRILDKSQNDRSIEEIFAGNEKYIKIFRRNIKKHDGMVLVTGPTGSGKTQTLAAAVNHIKDVSLNIITIEDPVEITNPEVSQVEVDVKQGRTFAGTMRQVLRQDPDVIMVGEMRDYETAHIGCEAALTGHLVFSTLHTNDAPSAITRFVEMGIKNYLVGTVVQLVLAQRLARTICKFCKKEYDYDKTELLKIGLTEEEIENNKFYKGEGCINCKGKGRSGRIAIVEMLELTPKVRHAIMANSNAIEIGDIGREEGSYFALADDALDKFKDGKIDLNEAITYITGSSEI